MPKLADIEPLEARVLETSRIIDAPRELVFEVWTDPRHLARWWGPDGFTTTTSAFDMRPGGVWRFVMHGPDGRDYENRITFDVIEPPARIEYRHGGGDDVEPVQFATTVTFEDLGGKTRLTLRAVFPTAAERDRVVRDYGADEGARQTLGRLADYLGARGPRPELGPPAIKGIVLVRTFDAPRSLVWRAWTEPKHLAAWWGPHGFDCPTCEIDLRRGGALRIDMRAPDGGVNMVTGVVEDVAPPERLVFTTEAFRNERGEPALRGWNAITLEERAGRTTMTLDARILEAEPWLAAGIEGMSEGWGQSLDKLAASLSSDAAAGPRSVVHDTLVIERTYDAPAALVFQAWASVEARLRWQPPAPGVVMEILESDFRVGGREISRCGSAGDLAWLSDARYEDIVPDRRIVMAETVSKHGVREGSALLTIEMEPEGERTRLRLTGQIAAYDGSGFIAGCREGWTGALDNLSTDLLRSPGKR